MYNDNFGPQVPPGQTDYLAKAGDLLDKAAESNERNGDVMRSTRDDRRQQLAHRYALLGAIQRGVLPTEMAKDLFDSVTGSAR